MISDKEIKIRASGRCRGKAIQYREEVKGYHRNSMETDICGSRFTYRHGCLASESPRPVLAYFACVYIRCFHTSPQLELGGSNISFTLTLKRRLSEQQLPILYLLDSFDPLAISALADGLVAPFRFPCIHAALRDLHLPTP